MTKKNVHIVKGEKLLGFGGTLDNPKYFIYTPLGTSVKSFLSQTSEGLLRRFISSVQDSFTSIPDLDLCFKHAYRARRIGRIFSLVGIDEYAKYIMVQSFEDYFRSSNPDIEKVRNYSREFGLKFNNINK